MDAQVSGSFIPKKPLVGESRPRGGGGLVLLIAILVFVLSGLAAGGVFAYQGILTGSIANKDESLRKAESAFEPRVIEDLVRLDQRLAQTEGLLEKHVAPSGVFNFLSTITLEQVQFTEFIFGRESAGGATIELAGIGDSFSTVALQSDQFGSTRMLKSVVFSDVTISTNGKVTFSVKAALDPALYLYARSAGTTGAIPLPGATSTLP